ncbi:MAG: hypothetical protein ACP6IS_06115 [Candidatus Asgardarchaeia archaeon]
MHYITKIVLGKMDESVHNAFVKYGRGEFEGPSLDTKIKKSKTTMSCSFGYESLLLDLFVRNLELGDYKVNGKIFSHSDFSDFLESLSLPSMHYKKPLYEVKISNAIMKKDQIEELFKKLGYHEYLFLSITPLDKSLSKTLKFTCKTNFPKPSKQSTDSLVTPDFAKAVLPTSDTLKTQILNEILPDFKEEIEVLQSFLLTHQIIVEKLVIPPEYENSPATVKRQKAIRVGKIIRNLKIGDSVLTKEYSFKA